MFERFSREARSAVVLAQEEARDLRSERIEAGHLLLALASDKEVSAAFADLGCDVADLRRRVTQDSGPELDTEALASLGIDIDRVRTSVESHFGHGALDRPARRWRGGHIPFHRSAKKSLECALREAVWLGSKDINVWHVLLGVLRAEPSTVDDLIGADRAHEQLRQITLRRLSEHAA
jgi:ATP-dependent Clp protease ATP-binding subunit ClpA